MSRPTRIFLSLIAGLALGIAAAAFAPGRALVAAGWVQPVGTMWLHALQMTIVPLVVSLLVTGIAAGAQAARASRLAGRAVVAFVVLLGISAALGGALTFGLLSAFPLGPELAAALGNALGAAPPTGEVPPFSEFLVAIIPSNPIAAAASDAFLPLILFTTVFAFAVTRLPDEQRALLTGFFEALSNTMLVVINWVLWLGPIGVGALAFVVGARAGTAAFGALAHYVLIVSGVGAALWLLAVPFAWGVARVSPVRFVRAILPAQSVAASTQSSLASLPAMLRGTQALGVPVAQAGVVLPLAVALFRWTGPAMNFAVAIYVAHWLGIELGPGQIAAGWAAAAITTMGAVGLPGTISFVSSIAPIAIAMGVPIAPLGLLVAVETIPDIFRTVGNVAMDVGVARAVAGEDGEDETDTLVREGG